MYFNVVTIAQRFLMLFSCLCIVLSRETWRGKLESKSAAALTFCLSETYLPPPFVACPQFHCIGRLRTQILMLPIQKIHLRKAEEGGLSYL